MGPPQDPTEGPAGTELRAAGRWHGALEVLAAATRLGLTSFGGPVAHLGYFRNEYVVRRRWVDDQTYGDLVALCQFLPGPASSQVGIALGIFRAGLLGGLAAWIGFTLPSAIALVLFGLGIRGMDLSQAGWLHGLKVAAVAVVAQAVWGMARSLCPDRERATMAILAALAVSAWPAAGGQVLVIALAGIVGLRLLPGSGGMGAPHVRVPFGRPLGIGALIMFFALLVALPVLRYLAPFPPLAVFDSFYRAGSLVFGGGHVVLPLLHAEVVPPGWVSNEQFLAGYGAAQAVPGPLFTFAAYLGAVMQSRPNGWAGAALALIAIFLPSFLLVVGALPFWDVLRTRAAFQAALRGINAAVVGLLLAALYHPVWTSAIHAPADFALALAAFGLLTLWAMPPWLVVAFAAAGGSAIAAVR
ncbi:MAG: chromate efflux transporter [Candidatus Rokubacteria bacterium]|nr:chromate efflux transporter [Candidatus Rokubacteria bacterium]